jgi:hypothetical protein
VVHAERDHAWVHGYLLPELGLPKGAVATIGSAGACWPWPTEALK